MKLTAVEIANEVRMRSLTHNGPFLLVEGGDDAKFFAHQLGELQIALIPSFGWENVLEAIQILEKDNRTDVLGIIDLDYRDIVGAIPISTNIVMTDTHSIETMMFASSAFNKILKERASDDKVKNYPDGIEGIRKKVLESGKPIGSLRFYNYKQGTRYTFEGMKIEKFVARKTLLFSEPAFLAHLRGIHPENHTINEQVFQQALAEITCCDVLKDGYRLCCGHDLMEILAIGLKHLWGTHNSTTISGNILEELFRLAYPKEEFRMSGLYGKIKMWFQNRSYSVLDEAHN